MKRIDLNADLGEGFPQDPEMIALITSANVCCGEHAGSFDLACRTAANCHESGVRVGLHPGFPDRTHMGRLAPDPAESAAWSESLFIQVERCIGPLGASYIKPHGAWYNALVSADFSRHSNARQALERIYKEFGLPVMLLEGSLLAKQLETDGYLVIREGFADRRYALDGTLAQRSEPGALLTEPSEIGAQVCSLALRCDSVCIHGDSPDCVQIAKLARETLERYKYEVGW